MERKNAIRLFKKENWFHSNYSGSKGIKRESRDFVPTGSRVFLTKVISTPVRGGERDSQSIAPVVKT